MALSTFLQALISIVFIYLILSLLTSELQEYLATVFEARAKRLKQSIRQMLGEQDYPYYRLEFNSSDELKQGNWIWLQGGEINKIADLKDVFFNPKDSNAQDPEKIINGSVAIKDNVVIRKADTIYEESKSSGIFYYIKELVSKLSVYESTDKNRYWARNVNLIDDLTKLTSDQQFIWIKDSDDTAVSEADVEPDSPPSDKGKIKLDSSPVTKYLVYSEVDNPESKVWIKQDIKQVDASANPTNNFVFVKEDDSLVNETDVIKISDSSNQNATYCIKGESIIELPVASVVKILKNPIAKQNESPIYLWDDDKSTILDGNNITVKLATFSSKPDSSKPELSKAFGFLIDKLYEHPNIQALNQSSFDWPSLLSGIIIPKRLSTMVFIGFVIGIILLVSSAWLNWPLWGFLISILVLLLAIGLLVNFYLQNEDKYGKVRKSIGPSYIEDPKLFAKTLITGECEVLWGVIKKRTARRQEAGNVRNWLISNIDSQRYLKLCNYASE